MTMAFRDREQTSPVPKVSPVTNVTPCHLVIRCLMEQIAADQWQAFSLEFGLAVQAESERDAKLKLERMIDNYLRDALLGEDREHAYELLTRRATWGVYAKYYVAATLTSCSAPFARARHAYREPLALAPCAA